MRFAQRWRRLAVSKIHQEILEKVQLAVSVRMDKMMLHGVAAELRAKLFEDHMTESVVAQFDTFMLGGCPREVYLEETVRWKAPHTWWDHLKESVEYWAAQRGHRRLAAWLGERVRYIHYHRTVNKSERVPTRLCPHVAVATQGRGRDVHFAWMAGEDTVADELSPWKS
jgi:hypothetical protein